VANAGLAEKGRNPLKYWLADTGPRVTELMKYYLAQGGSAFKNIMKYYLAQGGSAFKNIMKYYLAEYGSKFTEMRLFLAESGVGVYTAHKEDLGVLPIKILLSYHYIKNNDFLEKLAPYYSNIFLDSGAFSAMSQGVHIDIVDYIAFVKQNKSKIKVYANLDVIGNAEATLRNQEIMEKAGLNPLPCYHYGEDKKWLQMYCEKYKYFAIGGMVPYTRKPDVLIKFLDNCFNIIMKYDKIKIHAFGIAGSLKLLLKYPFYSVDSTSWLQTAKFGQVIELKHAKVRDKKTLEDKLWLKTSKPIERVIYGAREALKQEAFVTDVWTKRGIIWND
jgi:hypothetical protein